MSRSNSPRTYGYAMPKPLPCALVRGTTWDLFCEECRRHVYPNVVDLLGRYGDDFTSDRLWRRATCRECGGRLRMCGGMFVKRLQRAGALHRMTMPARTERPHF